MSHRYIRLLCRLYERSAFELGLAPDGKQLPVDQEDDSTNRRQALKLGALATAKLLLGPIPNFDWEQLSTVWQADRKLLDELHQLTVHFAQQLDTLPPRTLLPPIQAHLIHLTQRTSASDLRSELLSLSARTAIMAGLLSFRLNNTGNGQAFCTLAEQLAIEAGNRSLSAHAVGARSWVHSTVTRGGSNGDTQLALTLLEHANMLIDKGGNPHLRAWLDYRRAEEHAANKHPFAVARDIEQAESAFSTAGPRDDMFFIHWNDPSRLIGYRGSCAQLLGQTKEATTTLEDALARTDLTLSGARSVVLTDLASAYAQDGEIEHSCHLLAESLHIAQENGLAEASQRILGARRRLEPWFNSPAVQQLDEQLHLVL